jgi:hypothetical protein
VSGHLISADLVPVGGSYLVVMGALGAGLWLRRRDGAPGDGAAVAPAGDSPAPAGRTRPFPSGWPVFAARVMATVLGGYLLLMVMLTGYYYGVSKVGGDFLASAWTGCAMLAGLALPVFAAASWLAWRRAGRPATPAPPPAGPPPVPPVAGPEPVPD